jgi:hypothetical protein
MIRIWIGWAVFLIFGLSACQPTSPSLPLVTAVQDTPSVIMEGNQIVNPEIKPIEQTKEPILLTPTLPIYFNHSERQLITPTVQDPEICVVTEDESVFDGYLVVDSSMLLSLDGQFCKELPDSNFALYPGTSVYDTDDLHSAISPDGKWLVYSTASGEKPFNDWMLHVIAIPSGELLIQIPLVSVDTLQTHSAFLEHAQNLANRENDKNSEEIPFWAVENAFVRSLRVANWSPNSRWLAFSAQIDGPSTDVYLLDTETLEIKRMTDGEEQVLCLSWSPDNRWIVQCSNYYLPDIGLEYNFYAIDRVNGTVTAKLASTLNDSDIHWIDTQTFAVSSANHGILNFDYTLVYPQTQQTQVVWRGGIEQMVYSQETGLFALLGDYYYHEKICYTCDLDIPRTIAPYQLYRYLGIFDATGRRLFFEPTSSIYELSDSYLSIGLAETQEGQEFWLENILGNEYGVFLIDSK